MLDFQQTLFLLGRELTPWGRLFAFSKFFEQRNKMYFISVISSPGKSGKVMKFSSAGESWDILIDT